MLKQFGSLTAFCLCIAWLPDRDKRNRSRGDQIVDAMFSYFSDPLILLLKKMIDALLRQRIDTLLRIILENQVTLKDTW